MMKTPSHVHLAAFGLCAALSLSGCARKPEGKKPGPPPAMITVTQAESRDVPVIERSIGEADSATAPKIGAEVAGRITRVLVDIGDAVKKGQLLAEIDATDYAADAKRLEAQAVAQQKLTERYRELSRKGFVSSSKQEEVEAQNTSTREQYTRGAKNLARTRIVSPVDGRVDSRFVSVGDWIDLGKPVFQLSTSENLRIRLPFPESVAQRIRVGQAVTLSTPTAPDATVTGKIKQVRPMVGSTNRAFDAVVEVKNPGGWKPGASVNGAVIVEEHAGAVTVPEVSVVLRPAGKVVYLIENGKAVQHVVTTGVIQNGQVEILQGLKAGATVAVDGAGFLTDKATVSVKETNGKKGAQK
ncbi:MAG: efflux RND transporter periplasmic adaptor subunit [Sulfurimicrobium sp.]|nr:efflux RND transporter periplasmic adaptor subunit [Sulfurimicrobium sp.]